MSTARYRAVAGTLFVALFAAQAGAIALSPVLAEVASDLHVSTAWAGQLRTVAGLVAGVTALTLGRVGARIGLRRQLLAGAVLLGVGALVGAAAPSLALLAVAQVPVGAAIALLTTGGTLAAAAWLPAERRASALSWALVGQPAAWIVGMPLIGFVAAGSWRYAWLALPLPAAVFAAVAVARRPEEPRPTAVSVPLRAVLGPHELRRWLGAELLANTAWAGTLVYSGALLVESYGASTELTGVLLAAGAAAYVAGNFLSRKLVQQSRDVLPRFGLALAATTALFGSVRPSLALSTGLFAAAAFTAGGRTFLSGTLGLSAPPELRPGAMALRAASMQFGYFVGSFVAGAALAIGGYAALGSALAALHLIGSWVIARHSEPNAAQASLGVSC
jgi:DHA1 family inner membrane transport protein